MSSTISGNVGQVGATVNLTGRGGSVFSSTPSDSSSNFTFSGLGAGTYTISASLFGFRFSSKVITVDGSTSYSNVNLGSSATSSSNNPNNNAANYNTSGQNNPTSSLPF